MQTTIDSGGRIVVPKTMRDALGLVPGARVDISLYGDGLHVAPGTRTAQLVTAGGRVVATGETPFGDEQVLALVDDLRR